MKLYCVYKNAKVSPLLALGGLASSTTPWLKLDYKSKCSGSLIVSHIKILFAMLIRIKARGYSRADEAFVDKWLDSAHLDDEAEMKELKKALCKLALNEARANRSTTFRLVLVPDDDDTEDGLIDFSSKKKKKKSKKTVKEDDDDDE